MATIAAEVSAAVPIVEMEDGDIVVDDDYNNNHSDDDDDDVLLDQWLSRKQRSLLDKFLQELRLGRRRSSVNNNNNNDDGSTNTDPRLQTAHKTVNVLRHLIGTTSPQATQTAAELLTFLRRLGRALERAAGPHEPAVANVVRRVMAAVREEAAREAQEATGTADATAAASTFGGDVGRLSLQSMLWALPQHVRSTSSRQPVTSRSHVHERQESLASKAEMLQEQQQQRSAHRTFPDHHHYYPESYYTVRPNLKQAVLEAIQEIITDLEDMHRNINEHVAHHIHAGEIILTCGGDSPTVESFLTAAAANNKAFTVIVVVTDDYDNNDESTDNATTGRSRMAERLAAAGIRTTCITVAAVFAVMSRVHRVVLPAYAVLANGGLVSGRGANLAALAAHRMAVPVTCVTGASYQLCPMYPHQGQDTLQEWLAPPRLDISSMEKGRVDCIVPRHDYIDPQLLTLYITNVGSFTPSFIYRL